MRRRVIVVLGLLGLGLALFMGILPLVAGGAPQGRLLSVDTENLVGNRGLKLSWDVRNISGATTYLVETKKFPDNSRRNPPVADNEVRRTRIASNGNLRTVDITRLEPDGLYEFTIIPTNGSNYGTPAKIVKTAPSPSYTKGHQSDHTVLYKHGSFVDAGRSAIQTSLPGVARAWSGVMSGLSVCKDSSSCRGKNDDGGVITVTSVATTSAADTGGCGAAFVCVDNYTTSGSSSAIGKHIINADMIFESPGFSCPDEKTSCTRPTKWQWASASGDHVQWVSTTPTLHVMKVRADHMALHEFGHTFGLPDYYKRSGVNWDNRLDGLDAIMDDPATGSIRDHDKDQLEAIYARHTKND